MKKLLVIFIILTGNLPLTGQNSPFKPVTSQTDIDAFKAALSRETAQIQDIKADFVQIKTMEFLNESVRSTGMLYFAEGKRLRWEYEKPYPFVFILNGTKAWMVSQGRATELDISSNKMFKELSELMMFGMGGTSLFDNRNFDFDFFSSGVQWKVGLKPKSKEMKAQYSQIELIFDASSYRMESVRMLDASGDETLIQLSNQTINNLLPDALFEGKK